ncbi:cytosolic 5'-nucleotidase 1A-like [Saccoglossus kowalevskii]
MAKRTEKRIVIAVSSCALFDLSEENRILEDKDSASFLIKYHEEHEYTPCTPGLTFKRATISGGTDPIPYLKSWNTTLFLGTEHSHVINAIANGIAAIEVRIHAREPMKELSVYFNGSLLATSEQVSETTHPEVDDPMDKVYLHDYYPFIPWA